MRSEAKILFCVAVASFLYGCAIAPPTNQNVGPSPKSGIISTPPTKVIKTEEQDHPHSNDWTPLQEDSNASLVGKFTFINGKAYPVGKDGKAIIENKDLSSIEDSGAQVYHPAPVAGLKLSSRELKTLMSDKDAFFIYLKNPTLNGPGEVSFPILKGSLKSNLTRLAKKMGIDTVSYESDFDYYIPSDQVVIAKNTNKLLYTVLNGFPVEASIDNKSTGKVLRVYPINGEKNQLGFLVQAGSLKASAIALAKKAGWHYEWDFPYDFYVPKTQYIRAPSYEALMTKLMNLQKFPIKAEKSEDKK